MLSNLIIKLKCKLKELSNIMMFMPIEKYMLYVLIFLLILIVLYTIISGDDGYLQKRLEHIRNMN
uniref:Uncharacterized protein n=1 Tax=viral metagenome TaxID=1070528 RepID=A0A6C0EB01_9ZZZZ